MSNYGDLDRFVNEAQWELADYDGTDFVESDNNEGYDEYNEPSEPRPYWNGVPH